MERLKLLFSLIDDELADSMKYGEKAMHYTQIAGITVLVALMLFATKNDIVRIFFGG